MQVGLMDNPKKAEENQDNTFGTHLTRICRVAEDRQAAISQRHLGSDVLESITRVMLLEEITVLN